MKPQEPNSWVDYLATPPNMLSTPPNLVREESHLQPPAPLSINENQLADLFNPYTPEAAPAQHQLAGNSYNQSFQYGDLSELENRTLIVSNANPTMTEPEISAIFSQYGPIKSIDVTDIANGSFIVDFFDIRHSNTSKMLLNGTNIKGNTVSIAFAPLPVITDPRKPPNNGTIVIFHLPPGITDAHILTIFGQFGEIRQIRGTPSKQTQRFVEYWDIRAAAEALTKMNGRFVMGAKVSIEFSLPGGFRRGIQRAEPQAMQLPTIQRAK